MEINPYQAPASPPADELRSPLVWPLCLIASLLIACCGLWFADREWALFNWPLFWWPNFNVTIPVLLSLAIVSFFTFTAFARCVPAKIILFSRDVCIAQLVVAVVVPFLSKYLGGIYLALNMVCFVSVLPVLMHFTLRRLEEYPTTATKWTLPAIAVINAAIVWESRREFQGQWLETPERMVALVLFQSPIYAILVLRVLEIHRVWRPAQESTVLPRPSDAELHSSTLNPNPPNRPITSSTGRP